MKKLSLLVVSIILVAVCAIGFTACSNATVQDQLANVWRPVAFERFVYDMTSPNGNGSYAVTIKGISANKTISIGDKTVLTTKQGIVIDGLLQVDNGDSIHTQTYVTFIDGGNYLAPSESYRKEVRNGQTTLEINGSYQGGSFNYSGTVNGESKSGALSLKAPCYDNNEFHQVLRAATNFGTSFSFSFNVPIVGDEIALAALNATASSQIEKITAAGETYDCIKVTLSRSTKVAGSVQTLYYTNEDVTINEWKRPHVLVKIVEPTADGNETVYTLTSFSITETTAD